MQIACLVDANDLLSSLHSRLWGEPVNLREQHDALEFFNSLVDSLDEALKALGHPAMLSKVLGGSFADQKICQGCPHRLVHSFLLCYLRTKNFRLHWVLVF